MIKIRFRIAALSACYRRHTNLVPLVGFEPTHAQGLSLCPLPIGIQGHITFTSLSNIWTQNYINSFESNIQETIMKCNGCNEEKSENEFSFKNKILNIRGSKCKACHAKYVKKHYKKNKKDYIQRAKIDKPNQLRKTKELILSLKIACVKCSEDHPAVLDFHHPDATIKEHNIGDLHSRKKIIEESKKCIVLCSNCHRKLHYDERKIKNDQLNLALLDGFEPT
jgi:predicted HNH restriction endonuclease